MHFVARLRELSGGKPVGIKLCVGQPHEVEEHVGKLLTKGITLLVLPLRQADRCAGVAAPLEALAELADLADEREGEVARGVELVPIPGGGEIYLRQPQRKVRLEG